MRPALIIVVAASVAGCYCSHGRGEPAGEDAGADAGAVPGRDAGRDAGVDAGSDAGGDAGVDAGPPCRVVCAPAEVVVAGAADPSGDVEALLGVAASGARIGVLVRQYHYRGADNWPFYSLVMVDAERGTVAAPVPADAMDTGIATIAGGLHVRGETFVATVLRSEMLSGFPAEVMAGVASWGSDGTLVAQAPAVARFPEPIPSCHCSQRGTGFGSADRSIAAFVSGDTLWVTSVALGEPIAASEPVRFASLPASPPRSTPLSGALLADGRMAFAGGGYAPGLEPRDGFLVVGHLGEVPRVVALPGERFDPPPMLAVAGDRLFVARFVSEAADLAASRVVAQLHDPVDGRVLERIDLPTTDGLVPVAASAFRARGRAGVVWVEPGGGVRVLPPGAPGDDAVWRECGGRIETPPVAMLAGRPALGAVGYGGAPLVAAGGDDGLAAADDLIVAVLQESRALTVLRIPACRIERVEP